MSGYVWVCNTCGHEADGGPAVLDHREESGHIGAHIRMGSAKGCAECTPDGNGPCLAGCRIGGAR